ncbi:MAG: hypothetical protein RSD36_17450 [Terrisporobacter sp.]
MCDLIKLDSWVETYCFEFDVNQMKAEVNNRLNDEKLNIGLDRCKFSVKDVVVNSMKCNASIEKGEKAQIVDIATNEGVIKISKFVCSINGIAKNGTDNYKITLKLNDNNDNFTLDVNIPKLLYNTNERNASNRVHLAEVNQIIEKKLEEQGVYIDMGQAKLSSVEINVNSTDKKLYDAMKIIRKGFNTSDDKVFIVESDNNIESLKVKKGKQGNKPYAEIKVYNKIQQLKDTNQLYENENLVRIEVSTRNNKAIDVLTNNNPTMEGIIENWEGMERWFKDTLTKHIKKPCEDFNKMVVDAMVRELKEGHKTYDILTLQAEQGNLVDMELFSRAMKRYYKETGKKSPTTVIKNTKNRYGKLNRCRYDAMIGNIDALERLWNEIGL